MPRFVFTNLESKKGGQLAANPKLRCCYWKSLRRQIRIEGPVTPVSDAEADEYFAAPPSRIGAWASDQSRPCEGRFELKSASRRPPPNTRSGKSRPPHWSGFRINPRYIILEDGAFRLHDRHVDSA